MRHTGGNSPSTKLGKDATFFAGWGKKKKGDKQVCGEYLLVLKCQITTEGEDFHSLLTTHSWKLVLALVLY